MAEHKPPLNFETDEPVICFYEGAYGPTLRIDIECKADLVSLRDIFKALSEGKTVEVGFEIGGRFKLYGISGLTLKVTTKLPFPKKLILRPKRPDKEFVWSLDNESWRTCVGLVGGLMRGPGDQYFTDEGQPVVGRVF